MGERTKYFSYFLILLLSVSCAVVLRAPIGSVQFVNLSSVSLSTYTCSQLTVNAFDTSGAPTNSSKNITVTLGGLGSGYAYRTLADCQSGSNTTTSLFLSAGTSSVSFYYRNNNPEELTLTVSTPLGVNTRLNVSVVRFQVLGQDTTNRVKQMEQGESLPVSAFSDGTRLFVADANNNRVLVWNTLPTSNGQAASFALGQSSLSVNGNNVGGVSASTLFYPRSVYSNGTKLFVADAYNHRVLVWNTMPTTNGQPADFAIGQPNLTSNTANNGGITGTSLYNPICVTGDGTRLFIADYTNNRILVWNTLPTSSAQAANFAIGQPNLTSGTQNNGGRSGSTLWAPESVYSDGTRLFVADNLNNRVLVWSALPTVNGQTATSVLGQTVLTAGTINSGGLSASSLWNPAGVYSDGTKVYVSDLTNNRVLVWNSLNGANAQAASFALGQTNLTSSNSNSGGISAATLFVPRSVSSDGTKLYVADGNNNRILIWNSAPTSNGQSASLEVGQVDFTSSTANSAGFSAVTFIPSAITTDGTRLFVSDSDNNRVLVWNSLPTTNGQAPDFAIGQPNLTSNTANNGGVSGTSLSYPRGVSVCGNRLFVVDSTNSRVLIWNSIPSTYGQAANLVLGQSSLAANSYNNGGSVAGNSLAMPTSVTCDGTRVVVTDTGNERVLVWNTIPTSNGQTADFALGQPDLISDTSNNGGISASTLSSPLANFIRGSQLFVVDTGNNRVLAWNTFPTTDGQAADFVLGQPDMISNTPINGGVTGSSLWNPRDVFSDGTRLFVADYFQNRVLVWNAIPSSNGQAASYAIGQPNLTSSNANEGGVSETSLNRPTGIFSDGTRLFLSDYNNFRILITPIPGI